MDKDFIQQIIASGSAMLTSMAQAAKTTGEHLYMVLVKQQAVDGMGMILFPFLLSIIMLPISYKLIVWAQKEDKAVEKKNGWNTGNNMFNVCMALVLLWIVAAGGIAILTSGIKHIVNPEYYAIEFIIDSVKPQK